MTFGVDDYEKAIARIFQGEHVIGTGFLVAPGYVMTCAHVVLQAIGIEKENYSKYKEQPQQQISLDFHVLAAGQIIQSEVVAWLPYSLEGGDVAVLRLLDPEPIQAQPIPLIEVSREAVGNDPHSVYGFGGVGNAGGRSDAYRPKSNAAGGRFKLCKVGQPDDETIKPGFSGAPVWNEEINCVIGMVATAVVVTKDEQLSTAYAIPTKELRPILKKIEAYYLYDILMHCLECCDRDDQKHQLKIAIDAIFRHCNPQTGDRSWLEQLVDLAIDRPPATGWDAEGRLVYLAMMLAWMDVPVHVSEQIESWVMQFGFAFSELLVRIDREMKRKNILPSNTCQRLMVIVTPEESSPKQLRVSLLAVSDRETYNSQRPQKIGSEKKLSIAELPEFIWKQMHENLPNTPTTIHLFVPRSLFDHGIEMMPRNKRGSILGSEYPFVIRTNPNTHPIESWNRGTWEQKWEKVMKDLENRTVDVLKSVDCSQPDVYLLDECKMVHAAMFQECSSAADLFDLIAEETVLPVALWSRDRQFQGQLPDILDCIVGTLHDRVRQERHTAFRSPAEKLLGHHLSLVWEDPKIVPPDEQFNQEDC
jgi:hypothetical protein